MKLVSFCAASLLAFSYAAKAEDFVGSNSLTLPFDCKNPVGFARMLICTDLSMRSRVGEMNEALSWLANAGTSAERLNNEQTFWLDALSTSCKDSNCVSEAIDARTAELTGRIANVKQLAANKQRDEEAAAQQNADIAHARGKLELGGKYMVMMLLFVPGREAMPASSPVDGITSVTYNNEGMSPDEAARMDVKTLKAHSFDKAQCESRVTNSNELLQKLLDEREVGYEALGDYMLKGDDGSVTRFACVRSTDILAHKSPDVTLTQKQFDEGTTHLFIDSQEMK